MSTPAEAPPKKSKAWLAPVLAALLAGGGAGGYFYFQGPAKAAVPGEEVAEQPIDYGVFMEMDGVVINPKGSMGRRFFMVKVGIEAEDEKVITLLDERAPVTKDALLDFFGELTVEQLGSVAKRDSIKEALLGRLNTVVADEDGEITRIYFTQYVLQ